MALIFMRHTTITSVVVPLGYNMPNMCLAYKTPVCSWWTSIDRFAWRAQLELQMPNVHVLTQLEESCSKENAQPVVLVDIHVSE